jgi:hypothetical protein
VCNRIRGLAVFAPVLQNSPGLCYVKLSYRLRLARSESSDADQLTLLTHDRIDRAQATATRSCVASTQELRVYSFAPPDARAQIVQFVRKLLRADACPCVCFSLARTLAVAASVSESFASAGAFSVGDALYDLELAKKTKDCQLL